MKDAILREITPFSDRFRKATMPERYCRKSPWNKERTGERMHRAPAPYLNQTKEPQREMRFIGILRPFT
jgi:hypothetical protein